MRTRMAVCVATGIGLLFAFAPAAGAATVTDKDTLERWLVKRINVVREDYGLRRIRVVPRLAKAADRHANSMAASAYFRHELFTPKREPDWTGFGSWIRWYYPGPGYTSWTAGENLAWGAPNITSRQTVRRWLASPSHRANLLAPGWRNLGVGAVHLTNPGGYYSSWDDVTIVVANFGHRR
jgi:uncharacterized protein YkwD